MVVVNINTNASTRELISALYNIIEWFVNTMMDAQELQWSVSS